MREFVGEAGRHFGLDIAWQGDALEERGIDREPARCVEQGQPAVLPAGRGRYRVGDAGKAPASSVWKPHTPFAEMVRLMAEADDRRVRDGRVLF